MSDTYVPPNCTRDFACCSGDHECEYRLSRGVLDTCIGETAANAAAFPENIEAAIVKTEKELSDLLPEGLSARFDRTPLVRVGVAPELMDAPRTLREILFNHRALAGATALEITELMAELQPLFKDGA